MKSANLITAITNYSIIVKLLLTADLIIAGTSQCAAIPSKLHIPFLSRRALLIHFVPHNSHGRLIGVC